MAKSGAPVGSAERIKEESRKLHEGIQELKLLRRQIQEETREPLRRLEVVRDEIADLITSAETVRVALREAMEAIGTSVLKAMLEEHVETKERLESDLKQTTRELGSALVAGMEAKFAEVVVGWLTLLEHSIVSLDSAAKRGQFLEFTQGLKEVTRGTMQEGGQQMASETVMAARIQATLTTSALTDREREETVGELLNLYRRGEREGGVLSHLYRPVERATKPL